MRARYRFELLGIDTPAEVAELRDWLVANMTGSYIIFPLTILIERDNDAVLFKLRYGDVSRGSRIATPFSNIAAN